MTTAIGQPTDLQRLGCRIYTFAGWVSGTLLFTANALLVEHLNRGEPVLRLADARIPGQQRVHPYFIVERTAVIAVVPDSPLVEIERPVVSSRVAITHQLSWLLPGGGVIEGALDMLGEAIDLAESSRTDKLADTVSYSDVVTTASAAFKGHNYYLLERAAGAVAEAVLAAFKRVSAVKVTVHKPHAPIAAIFDDVGVVITRTRS